MALAASARDNVIVLRVSFEAYRALVQSTGDTATPRIAFDGESLELMSPSKDHERYNRLLEGLLMLLGDEWNVPITATGSMTLQAQPHGAEPDSSFYVNSAAFVLSSAALDLTVDSPPDIVVEIDMSRARIDKQSIYAHLRIREFWRYDGHLLEAFALEADTYVRVDWSTVVAGLPIAKLAEFLEMRTSVTDLEIRRAWRVWLEAHGPNDSA